MRLIQSLSISFGAAAGVIVGAGDTASPAQAVNLRSLSTLRAVEPLNWHHSDVDGTASAANRSLDTSHLPAEPLQQHLSVAFCAAMPCQQQRITHHNLADPLNNESLMRHEMATIAGIARSVWFGSSAPVNSISPTVFNQAEPINVLRYSLLFPASPIQSSQNSEQTASNIQNNVFLWIPTRSIYMVGNSASITRVFDSADIPSRSVSIRTARDEPVWSFSAQIIGRDALQLVAPAGGTQHEIDITINGFTWRMVVEGWQSNHAFGRDTYTIQGRSQLAYLAAPYATVRTFNEASERNASQLIEQELPGYPTSDWSVTHAYTDWLIPSNIFSYQELTPLQAITKVADSIKATIRSDPFAKSITVEPYYWIRPNDFDSGTPEHDIPASIITSASQYYRPSEQINGIYVSGTVAGVLALIKTTGTDGATRRGEMVTDSLITASDAASQRGSYEIDATGDWYTTTFAVPLTSSGPSLIESGAFVQISDNHDSWRGLVTRNEITAQRGRDNFIVAQSLTMESRRIAI